MTLHYIKFVVWQFRTFCPHVLLNSTIGGLFSTSLSTEQMSSRKTGFCWWGIKSEHLRKFWWHDRILWRMKFTCNTHHHNHCRHHHLRSQLVGRRCDKATITEETGFHSKRATHTMTKAFRGPLGSQKGSLAWSTIKTPTESYAYVWDFCGGGI